MVLMSLTFVENVRKKKVLYIRDRMNNQYATISFCISDLLAEIPWNMLNIFILSTITILVVRPRPDCVYEYYMS